MAIVKRSQSDTDYGIESIDINNTTYLVNTNLGLCNFVHGDKIVKSRNTMFYQEHETYTFLGVVISTERTMPLAMLKDNSGKYQIMNIVILSKYEMFEPETNFNRNMIAQIQYDISGEQSSLDL